MIIDGMMHLEANGAITLAARGTRDGLVEEVIEHYAAAGIDQGVVLATWMPSRESNDLARAACRKYPDRFIPFGQVRPVDDWEEELKRVTQEFGWTGHSEERAQGGTKASCATADRTSRRRPARSPKERSSSASG